ncbi:aspartate aminotransferase family protein [Rubrivirga sp. IMCC45206]|uniref:aspartate aminotransferase family protein n=1 Tax=Rubrivirga sp. IMCC45206 TaxID=3391614 RepID=UPI00398FDEE4
MTDLTPISSADAIALEDAVTLPTYAKPPIALVRGEGTTVWDADGRAYLDFYGGHCVALLGHCPPRVVEAIRQQAGDLLFYSNAMYSPVRAEASAALVALAPESLSRVFWCNSGTEANEAALKLARTATGRTKVASCTGGFHGRTLGALAMTHGDGYRAPYLDILPETTWLPFGDADAAREALAGGDVAALLIEPIQSVAGITEAEPDYYRALREVCDETGTMLVFDEVQTGVGRTGTFLYGEHVGVVPDMSTLAKSLGAGVPVGAVLVSEAIASGVRPGDQGTTFGGGMLAMAAVIAALEQLVDDDLMARATAIHDRLATGLGAMPGVVEIRGKGCLIGVALDRPAAPVRDAMRAAGVLVGTSGRPDTLRLMPPLTTTDAEIDACLSALSNALS